MDANGKITTVPNTQMNRLLVVNEDGTKAFEPFTFDLTYDEPNTEAIFTSFSVGGERGVIDQKNHTITVTLPMAPSTPIWFPPMMCPTTPLSLWTTRL